MRIKIDKKRMILSAATILAFIKTDGGVIPTAGMISQIMEIIGSIELPQKNAFLRLEEKIEEELGKLFDYLDADQCKTVAGQCFSMDCIEQYIVEDDEAGLLAQRLRTSIVSQTRKECDIYDMEFICGSETYKDKAEQLINQIHHWISADETLRTFGHQVVGSHTLSKVDCMGQKVELILKQIEVPNSAYLWHMPRQGNRSRELFRLHYTAENVRLYDRKQELQLLMDFCGYDENSGKMEHIPGFQWWMITGEGGTGKSRLAYEFSRKMEQMGWTVCYPFSNKRKDLDKCSESLPNDTLFIIDYTEMDLADIGGWMVSFGTNQYAHITVRVLLIQRVAETMDSLNFCSNSFDKGFLYSHGYHMGEFLRLRTISDESLMQLIIEYGNNRIPEDESIRLFQVLSDVDKLKRPLFAIAIADAFLDGVRISKKTELLDYLCDKEDDSIKGKVNRIFKDESHQLCSVARKILMMSTMVGGMNLNRMLEHLLPEEYSYLQGLYGEQRKGFYRDTELFCTNMTEVACDPIEPDIIGEYYVLKNIRGREEMLGRAWGVPYYMSRFVTRLYQDFEEHLSDYVQTCLNHPRLPGFIESIDDFAFSGCSRLLSVRIPEGVKKIGYSAFEGCRGLKKVEMAGSVAELSINVFQGCISLESVDISNGISTIPILAFHKCCSLASVHIPDSVEEIDDGAFMNCINLCSVGLSPQSSLKVIGRTAFSNCIRLKAIAIPPAVTLISESAFDNCVSLGVVTMHDGVEIIGDCAFQECYGLKEIRLPKNLKRIGELAFAQCRKLETVEFSNHTAQIEEGAFYRSTAPGLMGNLKRYCKQSGIDYKTLYLRKGIFEHLAQYNPDLYKRKLQGIICLDTERDEDLDELRGVCRKIGLEVSIWNDLFLISETGNS